MKRVVMDDFSGGIADGAVVTDRQVEEAHGLVLSDRRRLRSQGLLWQDLYGCVRIEDPLFWINSDGDVCELSADYVNGQLTVTQTVKYSPIGVSSNGAKIFPTLVGKVRWKHEGEFVPAAIIRYADFLNEVTMVVVLRDSTGALQVITGLATRPQIDASLNPVGGALPRARVACMWDDFLVLGDIEWSAGTVGATTQAQVNALTFKQYSNYIWIGNAQDPSMFQVQFPVAVAEDGAKIVGLFPTDEGLLVLTNHTYGQSGVVLLRGSADTYWASPETDGFTRELIAPLNVTTAKQDPLFNDVGCMWPERQSVLFVADRGSLYQYRGGRVQNISPKSEPFEPQARLGTEAEGHVAVAGGLVYYSNGTGTYAMRTYGDDGAWTEIALPSKPDYITPVGDGVVFVREVQSFIAHIRTFEFVGLNTTAAGGKTLAPTVALDEPISASYVIPSPLVDPGVLRLRTRSLGVETPHVEKWWHQVGLVVRSEATQPMRRGAVKSVTSRGYLENGEVVEYKVTLEQPIASSSPVEIVVPGFGPAPSCEVEVEITGDVTIERVTVWYDPATERW